MKLKRLHFPLLFLVLIWTACSDTTGDPGNLARRKSYKIYLEKAQHHHSKQVYDSAFYFYNKAKLTCTAQDEANRIIYPLISMAGIQQMQGDFSGSETSAVEALPHLRKHVDPVYRVSVYNQLGIAYEQQLDFENAIQAYKSALRFTKGGHEKAIVKNNLAVVEMGRHNYEGAIKILLPLLKSNDVLAHQETYARILDNLGLCYFKLDRENAIQLLNKAMEVRMKIKDDFGLVATYFHLSKYYEFRNARLARGYALKSYETADRINSVDDKLEALDAVIRSTNGEEAKRYSIAYLKLNDSLTKARQSAKNQFAKIRYDAKETRKENELLKLLQERQEYKNALLILIIVFTLIIVAIVYFFLTKKHRREKILEAYKTEMHISTRIHDELANDIHNIITFTDKHYPAGTDEKEPLLKSLDSLYSRARNMSRANSPVNTGENYPIQLREMLTQYGDTDCKLVIHGFGNVSWHRISADCKIAIHRILQELLINMKKHSQAANVMLQFTPRGKYLQIDYTDNGVGMPVKSFQFKNGLRNVENRIKAIGGKISFDSEPQKGLLVTIACPIEK